MGVICGCVVVGVGRLVWAGLLRLSRCGLFSSLNTQHSGRDLSGAVSVSQPQRTAWAAGEPTVTRALPILACPELTRRVVGSLLLGLRPEVNAVSSPGFTNLVGGFQLAGWLSREPGSPEVLCS